jgi:hypothetical protein
MSHNLMRGFLAAAAAEAPATSLAAAEAPATSLAAAADELVGDGLVVARRALRKTRGLGIACPVDAAPELVLAAEVGAIAAPELVLAAEVGAIAAPELVLAAEVKNESATEPLGFRCFMTFLGPIASTRKKW